VREKDAQRDQAVQENKMKVHWLIPITCDASLQLTTYDELARAFRDLDNRITTTVAYVNDRIQMEGFSRVEYSHTPRGSLLKKLKYHWDMLKAAVTSDADVIIFGFNVAHLIPFVWIMRRRSLRKKLVMDIRTIPVDIPPGIKGRIFVMRFNLALWLANLFCDGLTVITPMLGNSILPQVKRLKRKMGVWTSGVNLSHFERHGENFRKELGLENKKVLIYHGVLSPNRGLQNVVHALDILRDEYSDLVFLLVGDGPGKEELEDLARNLKLKDRVRFTGSVPYVNVPAYVRSADLAILPFPNIEWWAVSSPLKLMEYLAAGIPIVATDIEANRWVINETGGAVMAFDDQPGSLAESIRSALQNRIEPADVEKLNQTISWAKQARELEKFLDEV
jgi:glycosyltransferase involved in cell wall biosynthesis